VKQRTKSILIAVASVVVIGGVLVLLNFRNLVPIVGREVNRVRNMSAPPGTITVEQSSSGPAISDDVSPSESAARSDWPSYNKVLTSERFSGLTEITRANAANLHIVCTYDTNQHVSFQTGLLMINKTIIGTTEKDVFEIDADTCEEKWRVHEDYIPASPLAVNRGAAYLDGLIFRGTQDGRVLAYDANTGHRVWETRIADPKIGETVCSAPIAWNGLVFVGNAGGDFKGVKGRMYALDATTGKIVWEYYMVPKQPGDQERGPQGSGPPSLATWKLPPNQPTSGGALWTSYTLDPKTGLLYVPGGNPAPDYAAELREGEDLFADSVVVLNAKTGDYVKHFKIVPRDWHDWDVSGPPALIHTRGGVNLMSLAPKDGHLYGYDLTKAVMIYRTPVTTVDNVDEEFSANKSVHFCPGATGGAEWNGPAYDPQTNLIAIGEVDWCSTIHEQKDASLEQAKVGQPWFGQQFWNPYHSMGVADTAFKQWGGWVYGVDADSGEWKWRVRTNYPVVGGTTPTAGGVIFFGDVGGNFYVIDALTGRKLFAQKLKGAIGGGVITYSANGPQRVAVATGFESILWPTEQATGKVVVLGL